MAGKSLDTSSWQPFNCWVRAFLDYWTADAIIAKLIRSTFGSCEAAVVGSLPFSFNVGHLSLLSFQVLILSNFLAQQTQAASNAQLLAASVSAVSLL